MIACIAFDASFCLTGGLALAGLCGAHSAPMSEFVRPAAGHFANTSSDITQPAVVTARPICSLNRVKNLQDGVTAARKLLHQLGWPIPSWLARIDHSKRGTGCIVPLEGPNHSPCPRHASPSQTSVGWVERARCPNGTSRSSSCRVHRARITGADGHARVYYVCAKWMGAARHTAVGFPAHTPATAHIVL